LPVPQRIGKEGHKRKVVGFGPPTFVNDRGSGKLLTNVTSQHAINQKNKTRGREE